jgi:restriction system protein
MWKVNAGRRSALANEFLERNAVAIGWREAGDYTNCKAWGDVYALINLAYSEQTDKQKQVSASQIWRFLTEVKIGDAVLTYDPNSRLYHVGTITGNPKYLPNDIPALPVQRSVVWSGEVPRDALSGSAKGKLGAILTLFKVAPVAELELQSLATGADHLANSDADESDDILDVSIDPFDGLEDQAIERVKDKLLGLDWEEMQEIVAALLRALGYRTQISPTGPDRGKDIIASKDGFGFERPRIVVEVKHRRGQMGAQEIRSFLGGRHQDDRGLYVSTGGFSREARFEAERASTVTHLMTLDELAKALIEQYDNIDEDGRRILPLTKIYWPS